jgi:hypothetical protein
MSLTEPQAEMNGARVMAALSVHLKQKANVVENVQFLDPFVSQLSCW